MALQRIDTAYGPNPVRFNGNIQPQANANVFLGNTSYQFSTIYASTFSGTATNANLAINVNGGFVQGTRGAFSSNLVAEATTISGNVATGALVVRGGVGIAGNINVGSSNGNSIIASGAIDISSNTQATSTSTGALIVDGGVAITTGNLFIGGSGGNAITVTGNIIPSGNVVSTNNLGSDTRWWNNFYGVSTQARYADLAENYQADAQYEPGTVLEFGGSSELTVAEDGTRKVAGVVSTNPAHLMNGMLRGANVVPLALQGRTPCKVRGTIKKGDMLVSGGGGFARPDNSPQIGTVIGKALEDFNGVEGVIQVLVGRL